MSQGDMETIGLIAAMTQERSAVLRGVKHWQRIPAKPWQCFSFMVSGRNCLLITSGMGIRSARAAAKYLVETSSPSQLISFGIAGAVDTDLEIGDVVLPETCYRWEQGKLSPALPIAFWSGEAREAAERALASRAKHLYRGAAITTGGAQVLESQLSGIPYPVLEMETAGIASVAVEKGVPLRSMRGISDGPRAPLPFNTSNFFDAGGNLQAGKLLREIIHNPRMLVQSGQLMRNVSFAAESVAIALVAALGEEAD